LKRASTARHGFDSRMGYQPFPTDLFRAALQSAGRGSAWAESWWDSVGGNFESADRYVATGQIVSFIQDHSFIRAAWPPLRPRHRNHDGLARRLVAPSAICLNGTSGLASG
jgi:hypothetical protein